MKLQIQITNSADEIAVVAPFSAENNGIFRNHGGKFDRARGWVFPNTPSAQSLIQELWGTSESLVWARVPASAVTGRGVTHLGGYVIASRRSRDANVEMAAGIKLERGSWSSSGGSINNPRVTGSDDLLVLALVRRDFAIASNLEIAEEVVEVSTPAPSPALEVVEPATAAIPPSLGSYTDEQIKAELIRRGLSL